MDKFLITGGVKLYGEVRISGAKMQLYHYLLQLFLQTLQLRSLMFQILKT